MEIHPIAVIRTEFPEKFGIPRQSGLASSLRGRIVFEKEYRNPDALRGLEDFSHIWLLWDFSENHRADGWSPLVRPPRLGGNASVGVFATRSPFRPNSIGLSCVELDHIDYDDASAPIIYIKGADLMDGTPIYDIKPYIAYADSRPDSRCGYVGTLPERQLDVKIPENVRDRFAGLIDLDALTQVLSLDPRPSYQSDPERLYGMSFSGHNIRFRTDGEVVDVIDIEPLK